jgi:hypothetical protein
MVSQMAVPSWVPARSRGDFCLRSPDLGLRQTMKASFMPKTFWILSAAMRLITKA